MSVKKQGNMTAEKLARLAQPFQESEVKWKPQVIAGNRALVIAFIDARCVMDRLDQVMTPADWRTSYTMLANGCVDCCLELRLDGEWTPRHDVGAPSDQKDVGDRTKSGYSDSLKRAAVQFGVGRYLYRLRPQWVAYDPQKKQLLGKPQLPAEYTAPYEPEPDEADEPAGPPAAAPEPAQPEPAPRLSEPQAAELRRLLIESEANLTKFCERFGVGGKPLVDALDLHPGNYMEARQMLQIKIARKAAAAVAGGNGTKKVKTAS